MYETKLYIYIYIYIYIYMYVCIYIYIYTYASGVRPPCSQVPINVLRRRGCTHMHRDPAFAVRDSKQLIETASAIRGSHL